MKINEFFERTQRANGEWFYRLCDDRPDWLYDAVREAHDGEFPDDWRYETCADIAERIDDGETDAGTIADELADVYNADLFAWLAADQSRVAYCDDAIDEGLVDASGGLIKIIQVGQYHCIEQMAAVLLRAVDDNPDDEPDDDDDDTAPSAEDGE